MFAQYRAILTNFKNERKECIKSNRPVSDFFKEGTTASIVPNSQMKIKPHTADQMANANFIHHCMEIVAPDKYLYSFVLKEKELGLVPGNITLVSPAETNADDNFLFHCLYVCYRARTHESIDAKLAEFMWSHKESQRHRLAENRTEDGQQSQLEDFDEIVSKLCEKLSAVETTQ